MSTNTTYENSSPGTAAYRAVTETKKITRENDCKVNEILEGEVDDDFSETLDYVLDSEGNNNEDIGEEEILIADGGRIEEPIYSVPRGSSPGLSAYRAIEDASKNSWSK